MARARNIKPNFYKNYELADCGAYAQLLFSGLWCLADREGLLEDKPRFIKAEIFPYYDVDINGELTKLQRLKFIDRYTENGIDVIEIINFKKHQSPHNTEKKSELPKKSVSSCILKENNLTVTPPLNNDGNRPDSLIPDSLIPDSLIPDSLNLIPVEKPSRINPLDDGFHEFWNYYPKKVGKDAANKAWIKKRPKVDEVITALSWQVKSTGWNKSGGDFIPNPATYLNEGRWKDEPVYEGVPF